MQQTYFQHQTTLNCKGKLIDLSQPIIMGILNVTPDSFYDGGRYNDMDKILRQVKKMLRWGASIIDIGGMSSRPGAEIISVAQELERVIPVVTAVATQFPAAIISIDTVHSQVAKAAVEAGASMVNDISAGSIDPQLIPTVSEMRLPYVLMHMKGLPHNMQAQAEYEDVVEEVLDFFVKKIAFLKIHGIKDIILDPGFGFGKTVAQNYELLHRLNEFKVFHLPILAGLSRKSMIYKLLKRNPKQALNGTTIAHTIALQQGADILRVHDVRPANEVLTMLDYLKN